VTLRTLVFLLVLAAAPQASAQRVAGELRVGGAYDSNPALATDPGNRRGGPMLGSSSEQGVFRVGGFVLGRIGDPLGGTARFELDGRVFGSGDTMFWERLVIEGSYRVEDVRLRCGLEGNRLDVSLSADDAWAGAARCGALARLPLGFFLAGDVQGGVRAFDVGQLDGLFGGELSAGWADDLLAVELGLSVVRRESDVRDVTRIDVSPWAELRLTSEYVGGILSYRLVARRYDEDDRRDGEEHVGRLEVWVMPVPWIGGYADLELGYATGGSQALVYERIQVTLGVRLALDWQAPRERLPDAPHAQGPATITPAGVRFSFFLPDAERVAIVGDWNDWDEALGELARTGDGHFEGTFPVEPGRHVYHLVVDGEPQRPPGAGRYARDDFGGENAVLEVPAR
jgi:hypothetical protein